MRLAYYIGSRMPGQLSLDLSQTYIRNLRQEYDHTAAEFGVNDEEYSSYTFRSRRNIDEEVRFRNMEIAYNQTLGFLPELFRGTSVNVAYTRSYATVRRNKLAPHRLTSRLGYAYRRFNGSLGMVSVDESPDSSTLGRYNAARTQFDLSMNWKLTNRATLYVQGRNITGKPVLWYHTPPGMAEGSYPLLRQMQEYGANWVFGVRGAF